MSGNNRFEHLSTAGVRELQPYRPGKPLDELEREYGIRDAVKLASNENPMGPSPRVQQAISRAVSSLNLYPDFAAFHLRQTLAEHLGVGPETLTFGNGSNDVLVLLAEVLLEPGLEIVVSRHAFSIYGLAGRAAGATVRIAEPQMVGSSQPYGHDLEAMAGLVSDRTRLVFIANPNNPTGTWVESQELRRFIERLPDQVVVVVDEAYHEYVTDEDIPDCLDWLDDFPNLVVTRTFSKAYGLAGLRVGYAISHPDLAELMNRIRQPFNVNSVAQAAAIEALGDRGFVDLSRRSNAEERLWLREHLSSMDLTVGPSAANFLLVETGDAVGRYEGLLKHGVIVRPLIGDDLPEHLRITVGLPAQNRRLVDALTQVLG